MPTLRKLSQEEVRGLNTRPLGERAQIASQYDDYLVDFAPSEYGEVQLDEEDNRLTIRNRLQAAANRRGLALTFRRTTGPMLRFRVEAANGSQRQEVQSQSVEEVQPEPATVISEETQPVEAPKRRGRPPRTERASAAAEIPAARPRDHQPQHESTAVAPAVVVPKRRGRKPQSQK